MTAEEDAARPLVDEPMFWFLKVLDHTGGEVPAGDGYCPVAAFCEDRGDGDDTYNLSEAAGWSRTTHSGWGDGNATVSITDAGRAVLWDAEAKRRAPARGEGLGRYITFNPSSEEGNAVVSPAEPAGGVYWTLIGSGPDLDQNVLAAEIVRRLNGPSPGEGDAPVAWSGREHDLKTWREPFAAVRALLKPWELRFDDRGYQVGDILNLREWDEESGADDQYTGEIERRIVTWLLRGPAFGLPEGYVIMSMDPLSRTTPATP